MKDFAQNIIVDIIASIIISLSATIISLINPSVIPYVIIISSLLIAFVVVINLLMFGTTKFKWNHIHSNEKHSMHLMSHNNGTDTQSFDTIRKHNFNGCIEGYYDWNDVTVNEVNFSALNAQGELKTKDKTGNEETFVFSDKIMINNSPVSANYDISFNNNKPVNVCLKTSFTYKKSSMKPEYYFEVYRPTKKLIMELRVQDDVPLHNVKRIIEAEYGDTLLISEKQLKGKKSTETPMVTVYKFTIRNPKLLHKYKITWEWRRR